MNDPASKIDCFAYSVCACEPHILQDVQYKSKKYFFWPTSLFDSVPPPVIRIWDWFIIVMQWPYRGTGNLTCSSHLLLLHSSVVASSFSPSDPPVKRVENKLDGRGHTLNLSWATTWKYWAKKYGQKTFLERFWVWKFLVETNFGQKWIWYKKNFGS